MLSIFLSFTLLILVSSTIGFGSVRLFRINKYEYGFFDMFFIGLCFTAVILNIWSIFFPTNSIALLALLLLTTSIWIKNWGCLRKLLFSLFKNLWGNKKMLAAFIIALFPISLYAIISPTMYDTYLYHISSIKWLNEYPVVPGLANLHSRFGFNSSLHTLSAAFSLEFLFGHPIYAVNSCCMLVFVLWVIKNILSSKLITGIFGAVFLYYFSTQYFYDMSSPGTDVLPNITVAYLLLKIIFQPDSVKSSPFIFIILALFGLTLKISVLPVVLLSIVAFFEIKDRFRIKNLTVVTTVSVLVLMPWLIKNVILTGYLIYPMPGIDFFNFDWKVPNEQVKELQGWIYSWGRVPFKPYQEILALSFQDWFKIWWAAQLQVHKILFILACFSPLSILLYYIFKGKSKSVLYTGSVCILGICLWLNAPDIRFSFSFLLFAALLPILTLSRLLERANNNKFATSIPYIAIFIILGFTANIGLQLVNNDYPRRKWSNKMYTTVSTDAVVATRLVQFAEHYIYNQEHQKVLFYTSEPLGKQCFNKFPCTPEYVLRVQMRGVSLKEGFRQ